MPLAIVWVTMNEPKYTEAIYKWRKENELLAADGSSSSFHHYSIDIANHSPLYEYIYNNNVNERDAQSA